MTPVWYVYILTNFKNTVLYIGYTNNLKRRVSEHKRSQGESFTKRYRLYKLIWYQEFSTSIEAMHMEKKLKGWTRERKLALIATKNSAYRDLLALR